MMFFSPATHSLSLTLCALCNLPNKHKYFFNSYFIHECKRFLHALYNVYTLFFIASCSTSLCLFCKHKETQILSRSKKKIKFEFNKGYEMNLSFLMLRCFFPLSSLRYDLCVVVPCIGRAHSIKDQLFSVFLTGSHSLFSMDGCMHISLLHTHTTTIFNALFIQCSLTSSS